MPTPPLSRRAALRAASLATLGTVSVPVLTGCGSDSDSATPAEPDPLIAQADRARTDAALATAATASSPDRAAALGVVAAERSAHADALDAEVNRVAATTTSSSVAAQPPVAPPTLDEVRGRLTDSAAGTAGLARTLSGYRAGLLGSISASCTTAVAVLLP